MFSREFYAKYAHYTDVLVPEWITMACGVAGIVATYAVKKFFFSGQTPQDDDAPEELPCERENIISEPIICSATDDSVSEVMTHEIPAPPEAIEEIEKPPSVTLSFHNQSVKDEPVEEVLDPIEAPTPEIVEDLENVIDTEINDLLKAALRVSMGHFCEEPVEAPAFTEALHKEQMKAAQKVSAWLNDMPTHDVKPKKKQDADFVIPTSKTKVPACVTFKTHPSIKLKKASTGKLKESNSKSPQTSKIDFSKRQDERVANPVTAVCEERKPSSSMDARRQSKPLPSKQEQHRTDSTRRLIAAEVKQDRRTSAPDPARRRPTDVEYKTPSRKVEPPRKRPVDVPDRSARSGVAVDASTSVKSLDKTAIQTPSRRTVKNIPRKPRVLIVKPNQHAARQSSTLTPAEKNFVDHVLEPEPEVVPEVPVTEVVDDTLYTADEGFIGNTFAPRFRVHDFIDDAKERKFHESCPPFHPMDYDEASISPRIKVIIVDDNADEDDDDDVENVDDDDDGVETLLAPVKHHDHVDGLDDKDVVKVHTEGYMRLRMQEIQHQERKKLKRF